MLVAFMPGGDASVLSGLGYRQPCSQWARQCAQNRISAMTAKSWTRRLTGAAYHARCAGELI